ncbi:hypothetical protein [Nocardia macrotermitis]|uniref:Uncharacterized protein n=1 Tax=Nocardia macrotermitis TaxID=2585198 RepID=A0A7K0DCG2_9NOCA|nr:hypothetical protein [Nocardia macrotermitis]MQY23463.1 hypothetical protein [Nocardia macrotermitis]
MLFYTGSGDELVIPSGVCDRAELELSHMLMQQHHVCRMDGCAWKWVAYGTLVHHGRIVPPESSPRQRAHARGIEFPVTPVTSPANSLEPQTFRHVLDALDKLAADMRAEVRK